MKEPNLAEDVPRHSGFREHRITDMRIIAWSLVVAAFGVL